MLDEQDIPGLALFLDCEDRPTAAAAPDERPPRVFLQAPRRQELGRAGLAVSVALNEPGTIEVHGRLFFNGRPGPLLEPATARPNAPRQHWTVSLRAGARIRARVRAALSRGVPVSAGIWAAGSDCLRQPQPGDVACEADPVRRFAAVLLASALASALLAGGASSHTGHGPVEVSVGGLLLFPEGNPARDRRPRQLGLGGPGHQPHRHRGSRPGGGLRLRSGGARRCREPLRRRQLLLRLPPRRALHLQLQGSPAHAGHDRRAGSLQARVQPLRGRPTALLHRAGLPPGAPAHPDRRERRPARPRPASDLERLPQRPSRRPGRAALRPQQPRLPVAGLAPGAYRVAAVAIDFGGNRSKQVRAGFRVVRAG